MTSPSRRSSLIRTPLPPGRVPVVEAALLPHREALRRTRLSALLTASVALACSVWCLTPEGRQVGDAQRAAAGVVPTSHLGLTGSSGGAALNPAGAAVAERSPPADLPRGADGSSAGGALASAAEATGHESSTTGESPRLPVARPLAELSRVEIEARLVGRWVSDYHGRMTIDKQADRTARLTIDFDFVAGLIYGRQVTLLLEWSVDGDHLTHTIVGGAPRESVERIIRHFGATCAYRLEELTSERIQMREVADPDELHVWTPLR